MDYPIKQSFDEILFQLTRVGLPAQPISPRKVLFWGERAGEISSYVAGWLAGKGIEVIVLDGANRFDPYMASSFARKALIPPERLLKRIRIARAFTCYQMAIMVGERLNDLLRQERATAQPGNRWVILLDPVTPFMEGVVTHVGSLNWGYGYHVIIDHGDNVTSVYGHLSSVKVSEGQSVQPGDIIGKQGSTGWSTGTHLHFETRVYGIPVNPRAFLE